MMRISMAAAAALGLFLAVPGCGGKQDEYRPVERPPAEVPEVAGHEGRYGGHVFDLGDHAYLGELVFDEEARRITVYVLDHDTSEPFPVDAPEATLSLTLDGEPVELTLTAAPQDTDPQGKSSRFEIAGDAVPEAFADEHDLHHARFTVEIDGESVWGEVEDHHHHHHH